MPGAQENDPRPPGGPPDLGSAADPAGLVSILPEHPSAGTLVLRVSGEVDISGSPALRERVSAALSGGLSRLVIDLNEVSFLGTSGLAVLIEARNHAAQQRIELWLACARRAVLRVMSLAGLLDLFEVRDTVEAALAGRAR